MVQLTQNSCTLYTISDFLLLASLYCVHIHARALLFIGSHDILGSIVVSIPACHAGDQGSIPCQGDFF